MTSAALPLVFGLLRQVDALKALHRSGTTPSFGQVEALFDQAAVVRAALTAADPTRPANWPTSPRSTPAPELRALVGAVTDALTAFVAHAVTVADGRRS